MLLWAKRILESSLTEWGEGAGARESGYANEAVQTAALRMRRRGGGYHHVLLVVEGRTDVAEDHGALRDLLGLFDQAGGLGELHMRMGGEDHGVGKLAALATPLQDAGSHPLGVLFLQEGDADPTAEERTEDALKNLLLTCPHHLFVCSEQVLQGAEMAVHELFKATSQS